MFRLLVDDREDKVNNSTSFENYKSPIKSFKGNGFNIQFLGIDEDDGYEIYQGDKDSWKNFINYFLDIYKKYFTVEINEVDKNMSEVRSATNKVRTVTVDAKDYDTMKTKAEAFDKLIDIVCHDGVKFHQKWNKNEIRKNVKGGSVKVGEVIGEWHGEIKFTGDDGQKDFSEFVRAMIDGLEVKQRLKIWMGE